MSHRRSNVRLLWDEGSVEYSIHAVTRMQRYELTDQDVASVILTGSIIEHHRPADLWRWKIEGGCGDGHTASCVVTIEMDGHLLIVTVVDEQKKGGRS
jgi:hypothetical protein